jgi:8-oxo-dGTP diphosphatase
MSSIRTSAKAIIVQGDCLLLVRYKDENGDWYILPGGGQKHGEPLAEALQRECQEEIGTTVQMGELKFVREYIGGNHEFAESDREMHQVDFMFECGISPAYTPANGTAPDTMQTGVEWVPLSDLENRRLYPKVLSSTLRNGMSGMSCTYMGDVN